jgi:hypothetical protein
MVLSYGDLQLKSLLNDKFSIAVTVNMFAIYLKTEGLCIILLFTVAIQV